MSELWPEIEDCLMEINLVSWDILAKVKEFLDRSVNSNTISFDSGHRMFVRSDWNWAGFSKAGRDLKKLNISVEKLRYIRRKYEE
jgi:hypothetical protein